MKKILLTVFLLYRLVSPAQLDFTRNDTVPVFANSQQLLFPWAGGINFAQFSEIDLDLDGTNDLFVFDRTGNKITAYLNGGTPGQVDYRLAPQYVSNFPSLHDWVLLRDYNCDGKADIFTCSVGFNPGIAVWENVSAPGNLQFQLVNNSLLSDVEPNSTHLQQNIFVAATDIPAIRDIDNDGDMDVLCFESGGTTVEWHRNMSMELYGTCDSLVYRLETSCWGEFVESVMNSSLTLNQPCPAPPVHSENAAGTRNLHSGSCLECFNTDGDADQDLLIGDLMNAHIVYGRNGGTASFAQLDYSDINYPSYDTILDLNLFSCGFHADVNNDGARDLLFSPNAMNVSENHRSVWYYRNNGTDDSVRANFVQRDFLQDEMIETGEGAVPCLFDYDHDGDLDLFIGSYGIYNASGPYISQIALYRNIGSATNPSFALQTSDFAGLHSASLNIAYPVPAFADLDGDGDEDMLVGDLVGRLNYFRKDPGPDDNFVFVQSYYGGIDIGSYAVPQFVDADRDGLPDLVIGEQSGNLDYYHNSGTASSPNFVLTAPFFGNVMVTAPLYVTGYSTPAFWDDHGNYVLFCGSERGMLFRYDNIDGNLAGSFTKTDSTLASTVEGARIAPAIGDLNGDSIPDLILGNYAGGVSFFYGDLNTGIHEELQVQSFFSVYPNPALNEFRLQTDLSPEEFPLTVKIYAANGQVVEQMMLADIKTPVSAAGLPGGLYIVSVQTSAGKISYAKMVLSGIGF